MNLNDFTGNQAFVGRFNERVQRELNATITSNFALDVAGDMLIEEIQMRDKRIAELEQANADLVAKTTSDRELIAQLRERAEKAEGAGRKRAA